MFYNPKEMKDDSIDLITWSLTRAAACLMSCGKQEALARMLRRLELSAVEMVKEALLWNCCAYSAASSSTEFTVTGRLARVVWWGSDL